MFENLQVFENRYEELNLKLYDPATAGDRELYAALMKEHKEIEPIVEAYRAYAGARRIYPAPKSFWRSPVTKSCGKWPNRRSGRRGKPCPAWRKS